jgi:hypothetical protein
MERLAVPVPPPRFHLVRYHGILAPSAGWRDRVVPALPGPLDVGDSRRRLRADPVAPAEQVTGEPRRPTRLPWAQLLARVFGADALTCPRCGQPLRVLAAIQSPEAICAILECIGLPPRPPPVAPPALAGSLPSDL